MNLNFENLPLLKEGIEERYGTILAPYAITKPKENSRDYDYLEEVRNNENRSDFQRDRDRIIHSKAFRRLMYKTQVFVNHEGDHYRTRLTHTLEVSQFARGICKSLALNEDLAEAIALGHDLGHTPFGHAVERYINNYLSRKKLGEFHHNEQSVRVVDFIETRTHMYRGLNLTSEVREGILKHNDRYSNIYENLSPGKPCSSLEGQTVNLVDTIAYICHDLQDGIKSGLIEKAIMTNSDFSIGFNEISNIIEDIIGEKINFSPYHDTYFIDKLIHEFIMSITFQSASNIKQHNITSVEDVFSLSNKNVTIIELDNDKKALFKRLKKLIRDNVYKLYTIKTMDFKAVSVVRDLLNSFIKDPTLLPPEEYCKYCNMEIDPNYKGAVNSQIRVICDYISCMTDRFALEEHERIKNPRIKI